MSSMNWGDLTTAAGDAGFSLLPKGTYDVYVAKAEAKKTSTGKDQIAVQYKVVGGPNDKASVFNNFVISPDNPNALGFFFRHMKAMGLGPDYFKTNADAPLQQVADDLVGRTCRVEVGIRVWNEEERNQVDKVMPPLAGATAPADAIKSGPSVPGVPPVPGGNRPLPAPAPSPAPAPGAVPPPPNRPF